MATGATEFIDVTTAANYIPERWSPDVIAARNEAFLFEGLVDTKYEKGLSSGDTIHVPHKSHLDARSKTANTAITYETVTESKTDISIDQHYYTAFAIEEIVDAQSFMNQQALYAPELGYGLAVEIDTKITVLMYDFTQTVSLLATGTSVDNRIKAIQYLHDANSPMSQVSAMVSPAERANLIKQDFFVHEAYRESIGALSPKAKEAFFGSTLGVNFFMSTNVEGTNATGHDNGLFHKSAIAIVRQIMPTTRAAYDIDYLTHKVVSHELFGISEMRDDHGVWVKGK